MSSGDDGEVRQKLTAARSHCHSLAKGKRKKVALLVLRGPAVRTVAQADGSWRYSREEVTEIKKLLKGNLRKRREEKY